MEVTFEFGDEMSGVDVSIQNIGHDFGTALDEIFPISTANVVVVKSGVEVIKM
jgi:hypothetical protein